MNRRARLTLISVGLVALLTGFITVYYLKIDIDKHFQFSIERAETMREVMRMIDDLLHQGMKLAGLFGTTIAFVGQLSFEAFEHQGHTGELLAKIVVQIETDPPPLPTE